MIEKKNNSEARQRILETGDRLFYQNGLRAVGIDRIIADAGVAKMTLYSHFPSKDDLILAVLQYHEEAFQTAFLASIERHSKKTREPLRAFFAALKDWFESPGFRGCAFINASIELADPNHPGSAFVRAHNDRFATFLLGQVQQSVGKGAPKIAPAIGILVNGAIVTAAMQGNPSAADTARDAALALASQLP